MIKRIISAAVLIPIVVWLIFFAQPQLFAISILFVNFIAYMEWLNMDSKRFNVIKSIYFAMNAVFIFMILFDMQLFVYTLFFLFIMNMVLGFYKTEKESILTNHYYFSGMIYVSLYAFLYFILIAESGKFILMTMLISIWAGDSFAYLCGRKIGKTKLSPKISPKKTIEGAVCGIIFGVVFGVASAYLFKLSLYEGFMIGFVSNIVGILGDLAESVIKRAFNKKDSSHIIPGHGGVMDRLDSLAFSAFFVYMMVLWKIL